MPKIKRPPEFGFKYNDIILPLLIIVSSLVLVIVLVVFVIKKSDKVKEDFNQPVTIVSNCTIDFNNSKDGSTVLNCRFIN